VSVHILVIKKVFFLDHVKMSCLRASNTLFWAKERLGVRGDSGAGWGVRKELMVTP